MPPDDRGRDGRAPHEAPLLELRRVSVAYDGLRALSQVSMTVCEGAVVALLGANGAGKTTLLRTVSGLIRPEQGEVRFAGDRIDRRPSHRITQMGVLHVPEGRGIFPSLTVRDNLHMASYAMATDHDLVAEGVERFPALGRRIDQLAGQLSGGEQQMLALARALLARPRLLLLDEISMGLAPMIVSALFDEVRAMAAAGVTVLLVEQYVEAALGMADYAYVLDKGRIVDVGEPADLRADGLLTSYLGA
ncbi:MAG TPA: ABC transporter ATP-binding protein [Acidimicrobiales bacterium]|jgi:branched-chain amino acid transport system ATP-binding protein